jgi:CRP-like cAMP-binding protein
MQLVQFGKLKSLVVNETFIKKGEICKNIYFIKKGIVRCFYLSDLGEEKTIMFGKEGELLGIPECLFQNMETNQYWQALEPCEIYEISYNFLQKMSNQNIKIMKIKVEFVENMALNALSRVESFIIYSPLQRYQKLKKEHPEIIQRVADKHIAYYLGITPVSLSRIRKRIYSEKK